MRAAPIRSIKLCHSVKIIIMEVSSRRVNRQRRVALPAAMAKRSGIQPEKWVTIEPADDRDWALLVCPVEVPGEGPSGDLRDPHRPRRVTPVMQVTVPKPWMDRVGLKPCEWVFLSSLGADRGLRLVPQATTRLRRVPTEGRPRRVVGVV